MKLLTLLLLAYSAFAQNTYIATGNTLGYTDSNGQMWAADNGTNCSGGTVFSSGTAVSGTLDPTLYQYGRSGTGMSCTAAPGIGIYTVTLKFADVLGFTAPGQQLFNIYVNDTLQKANFDIFGTVRAQNTAYDVVLPLFASLTGTVTVRVSQVATGINGAQLQAISIVQYTTATSGTFSIVSYGAKCDSTTDDTAAIQAATNAASAAGGGIVSFPSGTCKVLGQIIIPNNGASPNPLQKPIHWQGVGSYQSGWDTAPNGGSILDLRYSGAVGKIYSNGVGLFEINGITFTDYGADTTPYIYTTYTTLLVHGNAFVGNPTKGGSGALPDQDAIILGGLSRTFSTASTSPFQGYLGVIRENYFSRMRRAVYGRTFANAVVVRDNNIWRTCGADNTAAAIEFLGDSVEGNVGGVITGNLIEMTGYVYGIKMDYSDSFSLIANNFYDAAGGPIVAYVYLGSNSDRNWIQDGEFDATFTGLEDHGTGNTHISGLLGQTSIMANPLQVDSTIQAANAALINTTNAAFDSQLKFTSLGIYKWSWYWEHSANKLCAYDAAAALFRMCIPSSGSITVEQGGNPTNAVCFKADGKTLGYCSSAVGAGGTCTCN